MKNKIKIISKIIFLIVIISTIIFLIHLFKTDKTITNSDGDLTTAEENILILSKTYPTNILIYGSEIDFDKKLNVTHIDEINEDSLKFNNDFSYQYIVINDLNDQTNISDEEWKLIDKTIKSDKRCNFLYIGSKELNQIKSLGMLSKDAYFEEEDLSVGLFHEGNKLITSLGTYSTDLLDVSLANQILDVQAMSIKLSNE